MDIPSLFDSRPHLERLLRDFPICVSASLQLQSPNTEDDEFIRCGMVGFAQNWPLEKWEFDHLVYVRTLRDEVMTDDFSIQWCRFTCLAAGYFLGMRVADRISDGDLRLSEVQTPGFMWLHSNAFM